MNSIVELISAYQADKLKLPALLEALRAQVALSGTDYRAGVVWIVQQRADAKLDPLIARALLAKLATLKAAAPPPAEDDDVTMVKPSTRRPVAPPAPEDDEVTRVAPPSRPPAAPVD